MAKDLSLKIAVKLLTKNFKSGVASVTASLRSMTSHFMAYASALGAGTIGLTNFIGKMREVAKETTSANVALKNISGSAADYASNMSWLQKIAGKYGVQINTLTMSFAKFKAAADIASMSAEDQRKIFESVARASVAYGMSAEDQRGVFMALQQMMSKGKVMAEELRLQMAERMPIAIQAMAKAAGATTEELDKMMKQGEVLSKDVLPRFAQVLNELIPNVDTNNLNKSLNDLSNMFVELTKKMNIEGKYKSIVETVTGLLRHLGNHTKAYGAVLGALFYGAIGRSLAKVGKSLVAQADAVNKQIEGRQAALEAAQQKELAKKEAHEKAMQRLAEVTAEKEKLYATASAEAQIQLTNRVHQAKDRAAAAEIALKRATDDVANKKTLAEEAGLAALPKNATIADRALRGLRITIRSLWSSILSLGEMALWSGVFAALSALTAYFVKVIRKARELRRVSKDIKKDLSVRPEEDSSMLDLSANLGIVSDANNAEKTREGALSRINDLLGTEYKLRDLNGKKLDELTAKARRYKEYVEAQAEAERYAAAAAKERNAVENKWLESYEKAKKEGRLLPEFKSEKDWIDFYYSNKSAQTYDVRDALANIAANEAKAKSFYEIAAKRRTEFDPAFSFGGGEGAPVDDSELKKATENYADRLRDLDTELELGLLTEKEYNRAKRDLVEKTYAEARALGDSALLNSDFYRMLESSYGKTSHGDLRKREEKAEDMLEEFAAEQGELNRSLRANILTEEEYANAMAELTKRIYEEIATLDKSGFSAGLMQSLFLAQTGALNTNAAQLRNIPSVRTEGGASPLEQALMSEEDLLSYQLDQARENLDILREKASNAIGGMVEELTDAEGKVKTLEELLRITETKNALRDLKRTIASGSWNALEGGVQGINSLVDSFERLNEVMNDSDANGFEKFMAGFEVLSNSIRTIASTAEIIEMVVGAIKKLRAVKKVAAAEEKAEATEEIAANTAVAASEAGKSAAGSVPFPYNLIAIGAAIAAAVAAFAALPKFEKGGIVGGNSTSGDKVLARLNSGEGVLTRRGVANLGRLAGSSNRQLDVRVTGSVRARGRDLEIAIEEQKRFKSRTK